MAELSSLPAAPASAVDAPGAEAPKSAESPKTAPVEKLSAVEAGKAAQKALAEAEKPAKEAAPEPKGEEKPAEPEKTADATTAKARELVKAGNVPGALALIGLRVDGLTGDGWAKFRKHADRVAEKVKEAEAREQEVRQVAERLVKEHEPIAKARKAYEDGEFEEAFKLAFGEELNSFQKKAIARLANPGAGKDPAVLALKKEIEDLRKEREDEKRKALETDNVRSIEQKREAYRSQLVSELKSIDDPTVRVGAEDPDFVMAVFEEQRKSYDPRTDSHLTAQEAAEAVLEHYRQAHARVSKLLGAPAPVAQAIEPGVKTARDVTAVKPTTLSANEASEAQGAPKLRGKALREYWANKLQAKA